MVWSSEFWAGDANWPVDVDGLTVRSGVVTVDTAASSCTGTTLSPAPMGVLDSLSISRFPEIPEKSLTLVFGCSCFENGSVMVASCAGVPPGASGRAEDELPTDAWDRSEVAAIVANWLGWPVGERIGSELLGDAVAAV